MGFALKKNVFKMMKDMGVTSELNSIFHVEDSTELIL